VTQTLDQALGADNSFADGQECLVVTETGFDVGDDGAPRVTAKVDFLQGKEVSGACHVTGSSGENEVRCL
jgi:hypothetical protein